MIPYHLHGFKIFFFYLCYYLSFKYQKEIFIHIEWCLTFDKTLRMVLNICRSIMLQFGEVLSAVNLGFILK